MSDSTASTKINTSMPLGSVANTLTNQHNQKADPLDYTADESMIAVSSNRNFLLSSIYVC